MRQRIMLPRSMTIMLTTLTLGLTTLTSGLAVAAKGPALKPGNEYMVVANYPNQMQVLDLQTDTLYKTCDMPDRFGPGALQVAPDKKTAYILNNGYEDIYGVNMDTCEVTFHAKMAQTPKERTKTLYAFALSYDGKELYAVQNPTLMERDHYVVQPTRLAVYNTDAGLDAKPVRMLPSPRLVTAMQTGKDGGLYMAGADIYKMDVHTGEYEVAVPSRNWQRERYVQPDVLNVWAVQTPTKDFTILYTTARYQKGSEDLNTADWIYGYFNINLETGATETKDFGPLTEIYFTGTRSPKDPNIMYGVLNRLAKYDIEKQTLIKAAELEHSYYCVTLNQSGSKVYLAGTNNHVAVFDADSLEHLKTIELPGGDMSTTTAQIFVR
ncbi:quinohemoprotein amine dehydrogenase subunit beta [Amphritea opalescens]|uniref:Quinohemoprotein amine dehydrogenase subunit beta n=1 Tax=Amphritea opalescens TaxID=2490544 RepID=A0A430KNB4_9GAMM|nr:quinohemoprotein amine dehydrogenase subunit beta [Amphritea opalescens]RTE64853.1 quinohemoprotein amine dehydrogenase subunit beta [Amphritea opalescens]